MKKVCIKCGEEKDLSGFRLRKDTGKYRNSCLECDRAYDKQKNAEKDSEYYKKQYQKHKVKIKSRVKQWKIENPEKVQKNRKQEKSNVRNKARLKKEKKLTEECKRFNLGVKKCKCCGKEKDFDCFYFVKNANDFGSECKKCLSEKEKYRKQGDIQHKIACNLRSGLSATVRGRYKSGSAIRDLGCSVKYLINHLESLFQPGMTWDNYGRWHIDHIIPLSYFDLTDRRQLLQACHYTNLQPLWAEDNLKKGSKIF